MNTLKTATLLALLSALLVIGGGALMGRSGLYLGLCFAAVMNFGSYFFSEKIALLSYSARPVTPTGNSAIYHRVAPIAGRLSQRMKLPMPKLWVIPQQSPNAFATGRNPSHASVALTAGILEVMDDRELEGVIAHELGHVLHRDILISSVAAMLAGTITMLASMARWGMIFGGLSRDDDDRGGGGIFGELLMMLLAPIAAALIQAAISRSREYEADAASARYTGTPYELISGLRKLEAYSRRIPLDASPATAHMFIVKPFTGRTVMNLFSTHPPTAERIARLQAIR
jgi:heat shock protein HtpX